MGRHNNDTLALAMDYASIMEACAAYVTCNNTPIREPEAAYRFVRPVLTAATGGDKQECMMVLLLDTKNKAIGVPRVATLGLLDSSPVHPREVFREAVRDGAARVILAHNHPSGDPTPSKEDLDITRRLVEAGKLLGICVTDHLICGRATESHAGYVSLRERNLVAFE